MKPEEIEYIREWAASGNGERNFADVPLWADGTFDFGSGAFVILNSLGLTIASQAERIRELERENADLKAAFERHEYANSELEDAISLYERLHNRAQTYNQDSLTVRELRMIAFSLRRMLKASEVTP